MIHVNYTVSVILTGRGRPTVAGTTEQCENLVDICITVDSSESIRRGNPTDASYDNWLLVLEFINKIVDEFPIGDHGARIGIVTFSNSAKLEFELNRYSTSDQLKRAVYEIPYYNAWTNTAEGLQVTRTQCFHPMSGDRPHAQNVNIIITDGIPNLYADYVEPEAETLRRQGVTMFAVGITDAVDTETLRILSSPPQLENTNYFTSPDFQSLDTVLQELVSQTCVTQPPAGSHTHYGCSYMHDIYQDLEDTWPIGIRGYQQTGTYRRPY